MHLHHNDTQEFLGDLRNISQSTVSRILTTLVPIVKSVLEEFVPTAQDAIEIVNGRVCLVDGTITPYWSYENHPELWSASTARLDSTHNLFVYLTGDTSSTFPILFRDAPTMRKRPPPHRSPRSSKNPAVESATKATKGVESSPPQDATRRRTQQNRQRNNAVISALRPDRKTRRLLQNMADL